MSMKSKVPWKETLPSETILEAKTYLGSFITSKTLADTFSELFLLFFFIIFWLFFRLGVSSAMIRNCSYVVLCLFWTTDSSVRRILFLSTEACFTAYSISILRIVKMYSSLYIKQLIQNRLSTFLTIKTI